MNIFLSIVVGIVSFGAVPNNESVNNADAINRAIEQCSNKGGGVVTVPAGVFTTGTVYMKSGVTVRLERGATLKGTACLDDYASLKTADDLSMYESGRGTVNYNSATDPQWSKAMIMAVGISNAGIEGEGCIDGADVRNPLGEEHMRGPHTILMAGCRNMRFTGFSVKHSANYAFLGYKVDKSVFSNLHIEGGWDGIHIRGGRDLKIVRCEMHTGDDAIAGGYWQNMLINKCVLNSSCNGVRMIMPSVGLQISDCDIYGPGKCEHITSHRTRSEAAINLEPGGWGKAPGRMDSIVIKRNRVREVLTPLCVTLSEDNTCGRIVIEDMVARGITRMAMSVKSWGNAPTEKVVMRRCDLEFDGIDDPNLPAWFEGRPTSEWPVFPCWGMYFRNVGLVYINNVTLRLKGVDYRVPYMCHNVGEMKKRKLKY